MTRRTWMVVAVTLILAGCGSSSTVISDPIPPSPSVPSPPCLTAKEIRTEQLVNGTLRVVESPSGYPPGIYVRYADGSTFSWDDFVRASKKMARAC